MCLGQRGWGHHVGWQRPWVLRGSCPRCGRLQTPSTGRVEPLGEKQRAKPVAVPLLWCNLFFAVFARQLLCYPGWGLLPAPSSPHPPAGCSSCRQRARLEVVYPPPLLCSCLSSGRELDGDRPQQHPNWSPLSQAGREGASSSIRLGWVLL